MLSGSQIVEYSRQAAVAAVYNELVPYVPADADEPLARWDRSIPIPNLGQYRPAGWKLIEYRTVYCDHVDGFKHWVSETIQADPTAGFGIIESGEFDAVVAYFTQDFSIETERYSQDAVEGYDGSEFEIVLCEACGRPFDTKHDGQVCPYDDCGYDPNECPDCGGNPCTCLAEWTCPDCGTEQSDRKNDETITCYECDAEFTWDDLLPEDQLMAKRNAPNLF